MNLTQHIKNISNKLDSNLMSIPTSNLLAGNAVLSNTVNTLIFDSIIYTGTGASNPITTGMESCDFTVVSNGNDLWHDRSAGDCTIKNDAGTVQDSGDVKLTVPISQVHIKSRGLVASHMRTDGLRGAGVRIATDLTSAEVTDGRSVYSFDATGFTVSGSYNEVNANTESYVAYQTLYTHLKWGVTNHGKKYVVAYNPKTNEVLPMWIGSGLDGHEIPTPIGVKLDYIEIKGLDTANSWTVCREDDRYLALNDTLAETDNTINVRKLADGYVTVGTSVQVNSSGNTMIAYGKAKSETWTIVPYVGVLGQTVEIRDVNGVLRTPRRIVLKRVDSTSNWAIADSERGDYLGIFYNLSDVEASVNEIAIVANGIGFIDDGNGLNVAGGQYIALVYFDSNSDGSGSYDDLASDTTQYNLTDRQMMFSDGYLEGHANNTAEYNTGTETIVPNNGWSDGNNYVYKEEGGLWYSTLIEPRFGSLYNKEFATDNGHVYIDGTWYPTIGDDEVTNGDFPTDITGWTLGSQVTSGVSALGVRLTTTAAGNINHYITQTIATEIGKEYKVTYDLTELSDSRNIWFIIGATNYGDATASQLGDSIFSVGKHERTFIAESTSTIISANYNANASGQYFTIDNISVYEKEATLDTALTTPITYLRESVEVSAGEIADKHEFNYAGTVLGMVAQTGNRFLIDAGTIFNNNRYTYDFPMALDYRDWDVKVEVYYGGIWSEAGWGDHSSISASGYGTKAFSNNEGLVVQTGLTAVMFSKSSTAGGGHGTSDSTAVTSTPARIIATYKGVINES